MGFTITSQRGHISAAINKLCSDYVEQTRKLVETRLVLIQQEKPIKIILNRIRCLCGEKNRNNSSIEDFSQALCHNCGSYTCSRCIYGVCCALGCVRLICNSCAEQLDASEWTECCEEEIYCEKHGQQACASSNDTCNDQ